MQRDDTALAPVAPAVTVFETVRATGAPAQWLGRLISAACQAAGISTPIPVEVRGCGNWGGWCSPRSLAPDGRIATSSKKVIFSSPAGILQLFLHEAAHRLLDDAGHVGGGDHDAAFFSTNLVLLLRADAAHLLAGKKETAWLCSMSLYDLQNGMVTIDGEDQQPREWQPAALAWAWRHARELVPSALSAEQIAAEISQRYTSWIAELVAAPRLAELAARAAEASAAAAGVRAVAMAAAAKLRADFQLAVALSAMGWGCFRSSIFLWAGR